MQSQIIDSDDQQRHTVDRNIVGLFKRNSCGKILDLSDDESPVIISLNYLMNLIINYSEGTPQFTVDCSKRHIENF